MLPLYRSKPLFHPSLFEGGLVSLQSAHFSQRLFVEVLCIELRALHNGGHLPRAHRLLSYLVLLVSPSFFLPTPLPPIVQYRLKYTSIYL